MIIATAVRELIGSRDRAGRDNDVFTGFFDPAPFRPDLLGDDVNGLIALTCVETEAPLRIADVGAVRLANTGSKHPLPGSATQESKATAVQIALAEDASPEQIAMMMGAQPRRSDLLQALFAGGILLPAMTKRAKARADTGNANNGTRACPYRKFNPAGG